MLPASGHSVGEIATLLRISPLTVENLKRRLFAKLDVSSSAHAVPGRRRSACWTAGASPAAEAGERRRKPPVLTVVSGREGAVLDRWRRPWSRPGCRSCLIRAPGRWPNALGALASRPDRGRSGGSGPPDWDLVAELGIPAVLVHSKPVDPPELAEALACGATALLPADRVDDHFLSVLRMVSQGYLVVGSAPMRPLIGAVRARWEDGVAGGLEIPELTSRESDILRSLAQRALDPADRPGAGDSAEDGRERPDPAVPQAGRPQPIRSVRRCRRVRPAARPAEGTRAGIPSSPFASPSQTSRVTGAPSALGGNDGPLR